MHVTFLFAAVRYGTDIHGHPALRCYYVKATLEIADLFQLFIGILPLLIGSEKLKMSHKMSRSHWEKQMSLSSSQIHLSDAGLFPCTLRFVVFMYGQETQTVLPKNKKVQTVKAVGEKSPGQCIRD